MQLLQTAWMHVIELEPVGEGKLRYRPTHKVSTDLHNALAELKPALLPVLKGDPDHLLGPGLWVELAETLCSTIPTSGRRSDLTEYFVERAAIYEYEGCLTREDAERRAFADLLRKWACEKRSAEN